MTDNDQHLRDLQREYLDFLDDEVNIEIFFIWIFKANTKRKNSIGGSRNLY